MTSRADPEYWRCFRKLPARIKRIARQKYKLWQANPFHPSLQFKQLRKSVWSVRITTQYRALALRDGEVVAWFWIGTHAEYDELIKG